MLWTMCTTDDPTFNGDAKFSGLEEMADDSTSSLTPFVTQSTAG